MGAWRASINGKSWAVHRTLRRISSRWDGSSRSAREEFSKPEGIEGVEHDQVEITRQPAMLEPVVEDDQLRLQLGGGDGRELDPVRVLKVGNVGEVLLKDQALVVDSTRVAVTPADQRD